MYSDKEEQKEYQKEWYRRKRRGEDTKIKHMVKVPLEEQKKRANKRTKKLRVEKRKFLLSAFGHNCIICGKEQVSLHNIYDKKHKCISNMSWIDIKKLVKEQKDEYIPLCKYCHRSVHWVMKYLHLSWSDIEKKLEQ